MGIPHLDHSALALETVINFPLLSEKLSGSQKINARFCLHEASHAVGARWMVGSL